MSGLLASPSADLIKSPFFDLSIDKSKKGDLIKSADGEASNPDINDQSKFLVDQKIELLRSLN